MRIGEIIGRLTCHRVHPSVPSPRFLIALPLSAHELREGSSPRGESLVLYDELGAGVGSRVGISEGREAANPFGTRKVPLDAYCGCLLDHIDT